MRMLFDPALSTRQRQIAILLAEGRTVAEIAWMLTVTLAAAADDADYLLRRLDRDARAKVAAWAAEHAPGLA
jgi:DNA-binding NarL/FixJ family response regulator